MKSFLILSSILGASAYPFVLEEANRIQARHAAPETLTVVQREAHTMDEVMAHLNKRAAAPGAMSSGEPNCGPIPCTTFDAAEQYVSTSGQHAFMAPKTSDIRGPCPGLNAAANHGYLNRNGIQDISSTVNGLAQAYGFAQDFAAALSVFSSVISGDIITQQWSIGGPMPYNNLGGLLSPPQGISFTHNTYEGDVSLTRNDAYMNNGDAHSLNITRMISAMAYCTNDRCTLDKWRKQFVENVRFSIANNPYYFSPPLAGAIVPPAAYNFIINFMSNHTAQEPNGYLDLAQFKSFFAVSGTKDNLVWTPGNERIPDNWYRRPSSNPYGAATLVADDVIGWAAYPEGFRIGGNTNGVNTYTGISLDQLSGGSVTNGDILKPNAIGCLAFQSAQFGIPDELKGTAGPILSKAIAPILGQLGCPALAAYNGGLFSAYPGASYNPTNASNS